MLLLKLLKPRTSQLLAQVGDIDPQGTLCWCDPGSSYACKLLSSWDTPIFLRGDSPGPSVSFALAKGQVWLMQEGSSVPHPSEPARANVSENEELMLSWHQSASGMLSPQLPPLPSHGGLGMSPEHWPALPSPADGNRSLIHVSRRKGKRILWEVFFPQD